MWFNAGVGSGYERGSTYRKSEMHITPSEQEALEGVPAGGSSLWKIDRDEESCR